MRLATTGLLPADLRQVDDGVAQRLRAVAAQVGIVWDDAPHTLHT